MAQRLKDIQGIEEGMAAWSAEKLTDATERVLMGADQARRMADISVDLAKSLLSQRSQSGDLTARQITEQGFSLDRRSLEIASSRLSTEIAERTERALTKEDYRKILELSNQELGIKQQITNLDILSAEAIRQYSRTYEEGMVVGLRNYVDNLSNHFQQGRDLSRRAAEDMERNFSDLFFDAMQGKLKTALDYWTAFTSSIERMLSDLLAKQLMEKILSPSSQSGALGKGLGGASWLSSLFGGGSTSGGGLIPWGMGEGMPGSSLLFHSGGIVGETSVPTRSAPAYLFAHAPRLHGGLASDEFPAILQRGEQVTPKGARGGRSAPPAIVNVYLSTVDSQSGSAWLLQNKKAVADALLSAMNDNHPAGRRR